MTKPSALRTQTPEIALPSGGALRLPGQARAHRPAWWKFFGPAFIISIGYFDPGNWATNLKAGSQFGYALLCVLSLSCLIGATIMPHNLYLHSHLAKARLKEKLAPPRTLYRWSTWDTNLSLLVAWFINVATLVVAAAVFHPIFLADGTVIESFADAYKTLVPILGKSAGLIFALALLVSGIASSTSATLAGQVVFEGFLRLGHVNPFRIRLCTRLVTMAPALLAILLHVQPVDILIWSQVVLSLQLPFAMLPLVILTDDAKIMGVLVNARWVRLILWPAALLVLFLNLVVLGQTLGLIRGQ